MQGHGHGKAEPGIEEGELAECKSSKLKRNICV